MSASSPTGSDGDGLETGADGDGAVDCEGDGSSEPCAVGVPEGDAGTDGVGSVVGVGATDGAAEPQADTATASTAMERRQGRMDGFRFMATGRRDPGSRFPRRMCVGLSGSLLARPSTFS
jgi:hypothetical protein